MNYNQQEKTLKLSYKELSKDEEELMIVIRALQQLIKTN